MPVSEDAAANVVLSLPPDSWLARYVRHGFRQTTAPLVYHIGVGLALLAPTCPLGYGTRYAGDLRTNNFVLLVGRSGEDRKSSALNVGKELLDAAAPKLIGDFPGSQEGLIESLARVPSQVIPISEMGKFLSSAQRGYFEPIKSTLADLWDCTASTCDILGEKGWASSNTLKKGDKVWALDPETDELVLSKVLDVGSRKVRPGERMVTLKGHHHDIRTTEGHRYYIKYRDPGQKYGPSPRYLVKTGKQMVERKSAFYLPFSAPPRITNEGIDLTDDELRFIAWAITDSTPPEVSGQPSLKLFQAEHKHLNHIRQLLSRLGLNWSEYEDAGDTPYERTSPYWTLTLKEDSWTPYSEYLDKDLAPELLKMNRRQFEIFWHELLLADGEQVGEGMKGLLWSTRETFIDRLQHLAVILGFSTQYGTRELPSGKTGFRMSVTEKRHVCTDPGNKKSIRFEFAEPEPDEVVWCATTEHGTIVTRNNGKVVILGNCLPTQRAKAAKQGKSTTIRVDQPRLSIAAACSIPYLEKHTLSEDWTGGFMGRWLVLYGRRERVDPNPMGDNRDFQWLADELKRMALHGKAGWCQGLDSGARVLWNEWYRDVMNRNLPQNIIGIRARAPTLARKTGLLLGWDYGPAQAGHPWRMDVHMLSSAIDFTELHIQSLVDLSQVIADHPDARLRRSVIMAIESLGGVATLGEILGIMKMRKRPIIEMLEALCEEGRVAKLRTSLEGQWAYETRGSVQII